MTLDEDSAKRALKSASHLGRVPIMHAALRGNLDLFNAVLREMQTRLNEIEVKTSASVSCFNLPIRVRAEDFISSTSN